EDEQIIVSVSDTGPGIAKEDMDRLFHPFEQLESSARGKGGSGLGLSISKNFVELHGGVMRVESEVGDGATFTFSLPIAESENSPNGATRWFSPHSSYIERTRWPAVPIPADQPRLVVIETGNTLFRLLNRYLQGTEIIAVSTFDEAIREIGRVPAQAL